MPNINKVIFGNTTLIDLTDTTATAADVAAGKYFYTAAGVKTEGTASGGGGGGTKTGTVSGTGTKSIEIPCSFAPDYIFVVGDLSQTPSLRGIVMVTIIKDTEVFWARDGSSGSSSISYEAIVPITGYNESDTSHMHASYANNILTIDTGSTSSSNLFTSGITYSYELATYGGGGSGMIPHTIHLEFTDSTDTDIDVDYDDSYISTMITAYVPDMYGAKKVALAQLDGVTWYEYTPIPIGEELIDYTNVVGGYIIDGATGEEEASEWAFCSDFTPIDPMMLFSYIGYQWYDAAFYDKNKNFLSGFQQRDHAVTIDSQDYAHGVLTPADIPAGAAYIRLTSYPTSPTSANISLIRPAETWDVLLNGTTTINATTPYNNMWLEDLGNVYPTEGSVWRITIYGQEYRCKAVAKTNQYGGTNIYVGNPMYDDNLYPDDGSGIPFAFINHGYGAWNGFTELPASSSATIKVERLVTS